MELPDFKEKCPLRSEMVGPYHQVVVKRGKITCFVIPLHLVYVP